MLDSRSFSVILALHPAIDDHSSPENSVLLTPQPVQVPAGRGLTVGRPREEEVQHYDHLTIGQELIGTIPLAIVPQRVLSLTPLQLPGGDAAVAASLSASNPDYWCIVSAGQRTGPEVWHRLYHGDAVTICRRDSIRDDWEFFLRAQILNKNLERPELSAGTGTLLVEKAQLEREASTMAGHLRRDLFAREMRHWDPWALVIAATTYLVRANKTDRLQDRLNAALDYAASGKPPALPEARMATAVAAARNTQFIRPKDACRILRGRYDSLAPASLKGYSFEKLFGIEPPSNSGDGARRLFYKQLWDAQIITRDELNAVAPYLEFEVRP